MDNPHTKPLRFWERLLAEIAATDPDVLFLAEAFARPAMMHTLAKIGFHQSYTYFTWRNGVGELTEYLRELSGPAADYMRPNFFVNVPGVVIRAKVLRFDADTSPPVGRHPGELTSMSLTCDDFSSRPNNPTAAVVGDVVDVVTPVA